MNRVAEQEESLEDKADLVMQHIEEKKHTSNFRNHIEQMPLTPAVFGRVRDQNSVFPSQGDRRRGWNRGK